MILFDLFEINFRWLGREKAKVIKYYRENGKNRIKTIRHYWKQIKNKNIGLIEAKNRVDGWIRNNG